MFDFKKNFKYFLGAYGVLIIAGIVAFAIFGARLSIDFKGGSMFTFTHTDTIEVDDAKAAIESAINEDVSVNSAKSLNEETKKISVSLLANDSLSTEQQSKMLKALQEKFPDNNVELGDSNTVSANVAGSFFGKAIVAVILALIFVVVYVGIRFRKIGGIAAGITSMFALMLDICVAFIACITFQLEIDANFIAVILTILGYSLNDTVVVFDRIRENKGKMYDSSLTELVNTSINQVLSRTIMTSVATVLSIIAILVVAEIFGLTSLRTFTIPLIFSMISGTISSITISSPLWVYWQDRKTAK